jgi:hypothetical protein
MKKFLWKTALYGILVLAGFEGLYRAGFLPVVTDSTLFDRKMSWLHRHPAVQPQFVVVGSSTALYGVRSAPMVRDLPLDYYNISSPLLNVASSMMVVRAMVQEYHPKYILLASNVGDFCRTADSTYRYYTDASLIIRRYVPEMFYLLDYHSIHQIVYRKMKVTWLNFDPWGQGVKKYDPEMIRRRLADDPDAFAGNVTFDTRFQDIHYEALDSMGRWLRSQNVKMIFVQCPIRAGNLANDAIRARVLRHFQRCDSIVEANAGIFINHYEAVRDNDSLFFDAVHLWPPGGEIFTDSLVMDLGRIVGRKGGVEK